jgi:rhamnulokinase
MLLVPDLLTYWLTGERQAEVTNASTTQLLDVRTRQWAETVLERVEIPRSLLAPLVEPGHVAGSLRPEVAAGLGAARSAPVITVASHDTASAVVAVPAAGDRFAYISCGTWSLVGLELESPVLSEESRLANFTNELGVDGTVRYLCNVAGMWLLQESLREWAAAGLAADLSVVVGEASRVPALRTVVDVNDPAFEAPGDMPSRIARAASERGEVVPRTPAETVRCILDSLALAYRRTIRRAQALAGRDVDVVHIVGGGARNDLLCQLTADACGLPVLAGPVEAAALGNVVIQARARGLVNGGLPQLRALIRGGDLRRFTPTSGQAEWEAAARRVWR